MIELFGHSTRSRLGLLHLLTACVSVLVTSQPVEAAPWHRLEFEGRKLFLEASVVLTATVLPPGEVRPRLTRDPEKRFILPSRKTLQVTTRTEVLNRKTEIVTLMRLHSLMALQRDLLEVGSRNRTKTYRFGLDEVLASRAEPTSPEERSSDPQLWSRRSRATLTPPAGSRWVTDPVALLVAAAVLPEDELRSGVERVVLSGNEFHTATLRLVEDRLEDLELTLDGQPVHGERSVWRLAISSPDDALELFGLSGDLTLDLDRETRVPIRIRGRVPVLGSVTMNLKEAVTVHAPVH